MGQGIVQGLLSMGGGYGVGQLQQGDLQRQVDQQNFANALASLQNQQQMQMFQTEQAGTERRFGEEMAFNRDEATWTHGIEERRQAEAEDARKQRDRMALRGLDLEELRTGADIAMNEVATAIEYKKLGYLDEQQALSMALGALQKKALEIEQYNGEIDLWTAQQTAPDAVAAAHLANDLARRNIELQEIVNATSYLTYENMPEMLVAQLEDVRVRTGHQRFLTESGKALLPGEIKQQDASITASRAQARSTESSTRSQEALLPGMLARQDEETRGLASENRERDLTMGIRILEAENELEASQLEVDAGQEALKRAMQAGPDSDSVSDYLKQISTQLRTMSTAAGMVTKARNDEDKAEARELMNASGDLAEAYAELALNTEGLPDKVRKAVQNSLRRVKALRGEDARQPVGLTGSFGDDARQAEPIRSF